MRYQLPRPIHSVRGMGNPRVSRAGQKKKEELGKLGESGGPFRLFLEEMG